jgi:hypothetical protein
MVLFSEYCSDYDRSVSGRENLHRRLDDLAGPLSARGICEASVLFALIRILVNIDQSRRITRLESGRRPLEVLSAESSQDRQIWRERGPAAKRTSEGTSIISSTLSSPMPAPPPAPQRPWP